jgi:hypothetical protein
MSARIKVIQTQIEADTGRLFQLANIVKLAAFAAESRRALEGYSRVLGHFPDADTAVSNTVSHCSQWQEQEDVLGEVLTDVGHQIEALIDDIERQVMALKGGAQ